MRRIISALVMGFAGGLLVAGAAYAHAAYLRSIPGADAIVAGPPSRVEIWFEQELFRRQGENTITVTGPDGKVISTGDTLIDDDDRKHIWVDLQPGLSAGKYLVEWKNVSLEDGHPAEGSFFFTIDPQADVTSTPMGLAAMTNAPPPLTTQPESTPQPGPATALSSPGTPAPANNPCALGLVPLAGLAVLGIRLRLERNKPTHEDQ